MSTTVMLHTMITREGTAIEYARVKLEQGRTTICQSVLLCRLTSRQLSQARRYAEKQKAVGPSHSGLDPAN
jgi:hypothetical protein